MKTDTIAAIATALSDSGIGIIRVSGEEAIPVVHKIYRISPPHFFVRTLFSQN